MYILKNTIGKLKIKNPLNFVNNFAELAVELVDELKEELSNQTEKIDKESASIDAVEESVPDKPVEVENEEIAAGQETDSFDEETQEELVGA